MLRQVDPDREVSRTNKKESLALLAQGRDAWNAWATKMTAVLLLLLLLAIRNHFRIK